MVALAGHESARTANDLMRGLTILARTCKLFCDETLG
jgi:hypothetical protein